MSRWLPIASICVAAAALAGCVSDREYRKDKSVYFEKLTIDQFDPTQTTDLPGARGSYRLVFVEFNDRGQMFEPAQLTRALEQIASARKRSAGADPPVIALFVHGWKNNASDGSGNVWGFRQLLAGLAYQYSRQEVVGIYIGWRGATTSAPVLKEFTVFDRHHASQRVPKPVMIGALQDLMTTAKRPDVEGQTLPAATMVLIGHSFGGAVLETAVTPALSSAIDEARKAGRTTVAWPADLIILLNEAQEAERSYPLLEQMDAELEPRNGATGASPPSPDACVKEGAVDGTGKAIEPNSRRPAIISISSTGDVATRGYFPGEQLIARPFQRRTYKGKDTFGVGGARLYYATTAHISTLRSHLLDRADSPDIIAASRECQPVLETTISRGADANDLKFVLVERKGARNQTPYWVLHMPTTIVPDHSTIFTQVFRDFAVSLIQTALLLDPQDQLRTTPK